MHPLHPYTHVQLHTHTWAPAGIFPGGGKPLGGPPKNLRRGAPIFFSDKL